MDKRRFNGGAREGAGRKPKADEIRLIEKLSPIESKAFEALEKGVESGEFAFVRLFFEYAFGKPRQMDLEVENSDQEYIPPQFNIIVRHSGIPLASSEDEIDLTPYKCE